MQTFMEYNRWLHIVFGFIGLVAFWVPLFAAKGGPLHRAAGRVFRYSAMVVLAAAGAAVLVPSVRGMIGGASVADNPEGWSFVVFLGYLALVTGGILSHGFGVLREKRKLQALDTWYRRITAYSMIGASLFIVAWALYWRPDNAILLYALSPIGIGNGLGILAVIGGRRAEPGQWKLEHLNALLGCGVAFHTAFAVFGMNRILPLDLPGTWQVLPWILPAAIGLPAAALMTRYYRRQFQRQLQGRAQPEAA
jgi:hypothetical protein